MFEIEPIIAEHKDVIHDVAYDYYGIRMATCSSDQTVKVWDQDETGKWIASNSWKAHSGSVWRVSWAHPEFGQVLATCSFDRTASVWEEIVGEKGSADTAPIRRWVKRTTLVDSRTSVSDVEFAPKYLGLLLATASADGIIRIYEAPDIMNLSQWPVQHEISNKLPLSCLSWNSSTYMLSAQLLAAGSDETATPTGKVFIYAYSENARKCIKVDTISDITDPVTDLAFAPAGRTFHILAVASKDLYIVNIRGGVGDDSNGNKLNIQTIKFTDHNCKVWRVCWNMLGTMLVSTGDDGCVRTWRMNYSKSWKCTAVLKAEGISPSSSREIPLIPPLLPNTASATAKYYKRGTISNPNQVPLH